MHKKIESELVSLAHSILQMKNRDDILALKEKAHSVYEKLSVLAFVDRYLESNPKASREEIMKKMDALDTIIEEEVISDMTTEKPLPKKETPKAKKEKKKKKIKKEKPVKAEKVTDEPEVPSNAIPEEVKVEHVEKKEEVAVVEDLFSSSPTAAKQTLEEELGDTIPLDVATDIFEKAVRVETTKKTLNDTLVRKNIQIGLNDRIAFVKHLFEGSQEDFNRVVSQLNSLKTEKESVDFISKMVKPDYDWNGKEEYEERFITIITRKFA